MSALTLVSHFLPSSGTHSMFGFTQSETPHSESSHAGVPTEEVHTWPQLPQFVVLTVMSVSQPSTRPFRQSACPASHSMSQVPSEGSTQTALPPLSEQKLSQLPQ